MNSNKPWYERAFEADYLVRYAHRSDDLARVEMPFVLDSLKLPARPLVLDLCCGAGRHSRALALKIKRGRIVALDLSADLLRHAVHQKKGKIAAGINYVRADKRALPLASNQYDGVVNLFTSFGYFESDDEHLQVFREIVRILSPGGRFVMDFMNVEFTLANLVPRSEREQDGATIIEERHFDKHTRRVVKAVKILPPGAAKITEIFKESVRAYTPDELKALFKRAGLEHISQHGDLVGAPFIGSKSPRCVMVCRK